MKNGILKLIKDGLPFIIVLLIIAITAVSVNSYSNMKAISESAESIGNAIGSVPGKIVGAAVGSHEGWVNGKEEAVNHPEVNVDYKQQVKAVGKLEPLKLTVKEDNYVTGLKLSEWQIIQAEVIYSIDLQKAEFEDDGSVLKVTLPQPEVSVTYMEQQTQNYYQSSESPWHWFDGAAVDGWTSGIEIRKQILEKTKNKFENDMDLLRKTKNIGKQEVEKLLSNVQLKDQEIDVKYKDEVK